MAVFAASSGDEVLRSLGIYCTSVDTFSAVTPDVNDSDAFVKDAIARNALTWRMKNVDLDVK